MSIVPKLLCLGLLLASLASYADGSFSMWADTMDISPSRALALRCRIFHPVSPGQRDSILREALFFRTDSDMLQRVSPGVWKLRPEVLARLKDLDDSINSSGNGMKSYIVLVRSHYDTLLVNVQPFQRILPTLGPPPSSFPWLWTIVGLSLGTILVVRPFLFSHVLGVRGLSPKSLTSFPSIAWPSIFRRRSPGPLPPPVTQDTTTCHVLSEIDKEIIIHRPHVLQVTLSREELQHSDEGLAMSSGLFHAGTTSPLLVRVTALENCRIVDQAEKTVNFPAPASPEVLYFTVIATHTGEVRISVDIWQDRMPVCTCLAEPICIERANNTPAQRIRATAQSQTIPPVGDQVVQLYIEEMIDGNKLTYRYELQAPQWSLVSSQDNPNVFFSNPIIGSRNEYIKELYKAIDGLWVEAGGDEARYQDLLFEYGGNLYSELIPPPLQRILFDHRHQLTSIQVLSREPFIPWELLLVTDPDTGTIGPSDKFLGEMGLIRWLIGTRPTQHLRIRRGKAFYVVPTYFHHPKIDASKEIAYLEQKFDAHRVVPTYGAIMQLLQKPESFDLLHFACHGETPDTGFNDSRILLSDGTEGSKPQSDHFKAISVMQNATLAHEGGPQPIVMINACDSARLHRQLTTFGGFAQAFMSRKAGVFIGALWTIDDHAASTFGPALYESLRTGHTLSEATIQARQAARTEGDATWLAYVVYGHPDARMAGV